MKVVVLAVSLVLAASSGNAHSIQSAYCNAVFRVGDLRSRAAHDTIR